MGSVIAFLWMRTCSSRTCIHKAGEPMAKPHRQQTTDDRNNHVPTRIKPFTLLNKIQRLQTKRRERRITAAHPQHKKLLAKPRLNNPTSIGSGQSGKQADHKRSADVDQNGAPRKGFPEL